MRFDVIIPTYRPDDKLVRLLERLGRQTRKPNRILVINTEETFWKPLPQQPDNLELTHISKEEFDHGATRRMGAERSDAEFFVCMTQDALPADHQLFEHLLAPMADGRVGAAYARQLAGREAGVIEGYTRQFNYPETSRIKTKEDLSELGIKTWFCSDVCAVYRKSAYEKAGGFVKHAIFNEDMLMAAALMEQGYSVAYEAEAKVWHSHRYTAVQQFRRNFDLGVSHREYREVFDKVSSESEGIRMVKRTAAYLKDNGKALWIPELIVQSGAKFLGYRLGKCYDRLPVKWVKRLSSSPAYFEKQDRETEEEER